MRLYEKQLARRYSHRMRDWRHCGSWRCVRCHWNHVVGEHERRRRRHVYRSHVVALTLTPIRYRRDADGRFRRVEGDE